MLKHNFVFYSSALPCGDASIVEMNLDDNHPLPAKRVRTGILDDFRSERFQKGEEDVFRTGARPVEENDPKGAGAAFHRLGVSRTKGGRGPESISMSCSDKITKWNFCGWQGAMMSHLLHAPLIPQKMIFGPCKDDQKSLNRAFSRLSHVKTSVVEKPIFSKSPQAISVSTDTASKIVSASSCLAWNMFMKKAEQLTGKLGYKHGAGKKNLHLQKTHSVLAPKYLFSLFHQIKPDFESYASCKSTSNNYIKLRDNVYQKLKWKRHPSSLDVFDN